MIQNNANDLDLTVDPKDLQPLFKTQSYRHVMAILWDWVLIAAAIYACLLYFNPFTYILAVLIIGARMHALAILMHDASHFSFLKNRVWNDRITNYVIMYPIFTSIERYRQNHMRHHRHLNTENDPDWVAKLGKQEFTFPKSKAEFLRTVFSYFALYKGIGDALWFLRRFQAPKGNSVKEDTVAKILFYVLLFGAFTYFNLWIYWLIFWVVPYLSTFFMCQYIRSVSEHFGELEYDHLLTSTRSIMPNWWERFILAPHNVGYHLEHHLYPGVPFYHLPKLHALLMKDEDYKKKAHITHGIMQGLMNELGSIEPVLAKA